MKMNKKKLAVVSLVLCVAAIISMGSLAWFTADDYVDNTLEFVTDFAMDLYETDKNGYPIADESGATIGQTYPNLKPGSIIRKDPTVVNKSTTEKQWIKMTVMIDKAAAWANVVPEGSDLTAIFTGYDDSLWLHPEDPTVDASGNYVMSFYLKNLLEPGTPGSNKTVTLFSGVKIPESMELADAKALGTSHIVVTAEALQSDAGTDVLTAFAAEAAVKAAAEEASN